jgi:hypothetical protein
MTVINKAKTPKIVFLLSLLTSIFWCLGQLVNVYYFPIVGVIFELLWLPMIALLIVLPTLSLVYLLKKVEKRKPLYLLSFLMVVATVLFTIL